MRLATVTLALVIAASAVAVADQPANPLIAAHAESGTTPAGALKAWFDGVFLYLDEGTRDQGRVALAFLTIPFKDDPGWERRPSNATFVSRLKDPAHAHIFRSYAEGTSPGNGYAMDPADYRLAIVEEGDDAHGRGYRILLRSSGADNPRPVYLRRSTTTGLWYVSEFGNVYVGIRAPKDPGRETFE